uniref:Gypsy retrotransposon integrase-like protein 1 n=1 Tax=Leptobrachium leishanense TaxID=445787 RepID=A0A8C5M0Y9_9ANUR
MLTLHIEGKPISFLIDTGATTSTIESKYYSGPLAKSEPSMGIIGVSTNTFSTRPLALTTPDGKSLLYHMFTVIEDCPISLLGRDLLGKLEVNIYSRTRGLIIDSPSISLFLDKQHHFFMTTDTLPTELRELDRLWSNGPYDTGLISCTPYEAILHENCQPVYQKQYPLSKEKEDGLRPMIDQFLQDGILEPVVSPFSTPINPVRKPDGTVRFVQDLLAINSLVIPIAPIVPDITTLLSSIPATHTHFSVIDLKNAFFSIPIHPETALLFAFTFEGTQFTWKRLPQGYVDAPVVYSIVLQATLKSWHPSHGSVLLQYVDDLLVCSPSEEACREDGKSLLRWLQECGHKVSLKKMQWCQTQVEYLGFVLRQGERSISQKRVQSVTGLVNPKTKKDMLSFLGMINYCRQWIPDCSYYDNILRQATLLGKSNMITWSNEMLNAFKVLRNAMMTSPALGLPDYVLPFHLFARDNCKTMAGVLTQEHGGRLRPVAFFSKILPVTVQGMPACLRALAACTMPVSMASQYTLGYETHLHTTHDVLSLLKGIHTQHMSSQRFSGYEVTLLSNPALSSVSGPASILNALLGLKNPSDTIPLEHDCALSIESETAPRPDLMSTPVPDADVVFVDGSCTCPNDNTYHAAYAVVQLPDTVLESGPVPYQSAQAAELIALTRACRLYAGRPVTIYTDSKYAYGVVHDHGTIWEKRGFVAADGKKISHSTLVTDLLASILMPSQIAVLHCRAHTRASDPIAKGNHLADQAAKRAAQQDIAKLVMPVLRPPTMDGDQLFCTLQKYATTEELKDWCYPILQKNSNTGLITKDGKPCIPQSSASLFIDNFHGVGHNNIGTTITLLSQHFYIQNLRSLVRDYVSRCIICLRNYPNNPHKVDHQHLDYPTTPFTHLQIDFTHIPRTEGKRQEYALVIVDMFSRWPEVFPTKAEDAKTVVRILTREIIPRWGVPLQLNSDKGTAFTSRVSKSLVRALQVEWKYHIPWHPQSSELVQRMNRSVKDRLRKATGGTFKNWKLVLPIILAEIRMAVNRNTGYSPFEILMGRPFPLPWSTGRLTVETGDLEQIRDEYVRQLISTLETTRDEVIFKSPFFQTNLPTHLIQETRCW